MTRPGASRSAGSPGAAARGARRPAVGLLAVVLAVVTAASVAACGAAPGGRARTVTVFAAASLTDVFTRLEQRFERTHPDVDVRLNVAGSSRLAQQIAEGAPADVFASADRRTMRRLAERDLLDTAPTTFATNTLTIAVAPGNPRRVTGFADLARPGLTVVVCAPPVPCGAATERLERATGVSLRPASEEPDVRAVLTKVETGEADAGLVYVTDVAASDAVEGVRVPEAGEVGNTYPIAIPAGAAEPELAREFRGLVLGETGRHTLAEAGFGTP